MQNNLFNIVLLTRQMNLDMAKGCISNDYGF